MAVSVILSAIGGAGSQFFDNNGAVLSGGKLYTYAAGTTTPQTTYTDSTGTTTQANPVVLDSAGRVPSNGVWLDYTLQYKLVLKDSLGNTLGTWDNYPSTSVSASISGLQTQINTINTNTTAIANVFVSAVRASTTQAFPASATTQIQYNSEVTDLGNNYNPGTYTFTALAAGTYEISAAAIFTPDSASAAGDVITLELYKNGSYVETLDQRTMYTVNSYNMFLKGSIPLHLAANDTITIYAQTSSTHTWTLLADGRFCYFNVTRIS